MQVLAQSAAAFVPLVRTAVQPSVQSFPLVATDVDSVSVPEAEAFHFMSAPAQVSSSAIKGFHWHSCCLSSFDFDSTYGVASSDFVPPSSIVAFLFLSFLIIFSRRRLTFVVLNYPSVLWYLLRRHTRRLFYISFPCNPIIILPLRSLSPRSSTTHSLPPLASYSSQSSSPTSSSPGSTAVFSCGFLFPVSTSLTSCVSRLLSLLQFRRFRAWHFLSSLPALHRRPSFSPSALLACMPILACVFVAMTVPPANAAALPSIFVDPQNGSDADGCGGVAPCKTVAHAVRKLKGGGTSISLAAGVYLEPSVNISSFASLIISGVPSATIFDCSRRLHTPGAVFYIRNSSLTITGVTFMNCVNTNSNGGALAAVGSSVAVMQCSFMNCSAASGGAMHITGSDNRVFVNVQNSSFLGNSAVADAQTPLPRHVRRGAVLSHLMTCSTLRSAAASWSKITCGRQCPQHHGSTVRPGTRLLAVAVYPCYFPAIPAAPLYGSPATRLSCAQCMCRAATM